MWELIYIFSGVLGVLLGLWGLFDSQQSGETEKNGSGLDKRRELVPVKVRSEGFPFRK